MFLLMERFCLTQRILLPSTVEFDESEHWKTENIHFRFPFLTSWHGRQRSRCLKSLLQSVELSPEVVQYIYVANLKCMATQ